MYEAALSEIEAAVHPHMCGVDLAALPNATKLGGSSPHVRGRYEICMNVIGLTRFIPTSVG